MIEFLMKKLLFVGLSVLLFGGIFLILRSGREPDRELKMASGSFIEEIRILQKKKGTTLWDLTAKRADFETEDRAKLSDVRISLQKSGVVLFADKGTYSIADKSFTTESAVKADGKDYSITGDSVDFDVVSGNVRTDGRIKMEGKSFDVEGKGLKAETGKKVEIFDDVKATFHK
jgi:lipopolysaccharide assembly outer membrane protein LptD (OstA)